jgi:Tfp pilus assembly PilM family ATPase
LDGAIDAVFGGKIRKKQGSNMLDFLKKRSSAIGLDISDDIVKISQLNANGGDVSLFAAGSETRPENIERGSAAWQRWVISAINNVLGNSKFSGKDAVACLPARNIFIDYVRVGGSSNMAEEKLSEMIFPKIKGRLPFDASEAIIKYVPASDDNVVVLAAERQKIEIHLAIYERVPLSVKSIAVWPLTLANCYAKFFARRRTDFESVVMLADVGPESVNVVISRHKHLLYARSLDFGLNQLNGEDGSRLALELNACRRSFGSMYRSGQIERLIFLSGNAINKETFAKIAKQMELPAQMGDCLAAVRIENPWNCKVERRGCRESWATAFGLSLSEES